VEASLCIQVLQRRFPTDQRNRAFSALRRPGAQDEGNPKHTPNPTHGVSNIAGKHKLMIPLLGNL